MIIIIENFKLVQEGLFFNLVRTIQSEETVIKEEGGKKTRVKTGNLVERDVDFGYGMSLESCIKKIIMTNLSDRELEVSLKQWIKMYQEEQEKIKQLLTL